MRDHTTDSMDGSPMMINYFIIGQGSIKVIA
jgi:hypothetical protein